MFWLKNGELVDTSRDVNFIISNEGNLIVSQTRLGDTGNYTCGAQNIANRRLSEPALLTVFGSLLTFHMSVPVIRLISWSFLSTDLNHEIAVLAEVRVLVRTRLYLWKTVMTHCSVPICQNDLNKLATRQLLRPRCYFLIVSYPIPNLLGNWIDLDDKLLVDGGWETINCEEFSAESLYWLNLEASRALRINLSWHTTRRFVHFPSLISSQLGTNTLIGVWLN